jgi:minor extracellular serine protease Vpr
MNRRLLTAVGAAALMVATVMPMGVTAARPRLENQAKRFERVDISKIDKSLIKSILSDHDVNVIVEMTGPSATARGGSKVQQVAVAGRLKAHQDVLARSVRTMGGTVEAKYQYAYNGIKVRVPSRKVAALAKQPGVKAIHPVPTYTVDNRRSVPFIGAPAVWQDFGDTGSGQTIAVIDTGIDYTHANFGGTGTEAAYDDNDPTIIDPASFPTAKVIDGWDFVGDAYNPANTDGTEVPAPDPDPLDCNGHGSHVAGTAAGFGVKSDHTTYTGPYNSTTYATSFGIGPGVAPKAKLVSLKVFGCEGGTNVLTDALEWVGTYNATHADAIDVVNMSIGGVGGNEQPDAQASNTLAAAGVVVVASAGNEGPNAFMTGSPGNATGVLSVAASDTIRTFPGATIDRTTGADLNGINENDWPGLPVTGTLKVITDNPATGTPLGDGDEHLGCVAADYGVLPPNSIAVIQRGFCTFVDKGAAAEAAGAVGVIVINRDDIADPLELPTFIGYTPSIFDIPMIGIGRGAKLTLQGSDGIGATLKAGPSITNAAYLNNADFSSGGPRLGDNAQKPDVSAPGVNITSTAVGLGYKGDTLSGTSMASPHVAGVAALVHSKHPTWKPEQIKAAIVGTAVQSKVSPYNPRIAGSGMVQPRRAADTVAYVLATDRTPNLSFGYDQIRLGQYRETKSFTIYNTGNKDITYKLTAGSIVKLSKTEVTVKAHSSKVIDATATLNATQLAASRFASQSLPGGTAFGGVLSYGGVITANPKNNGTGRYTLRVPWRAVPRAASNIVPSAKSAYTSAGGTSSATIKLANNGTHASFADVYAWGLSDPRDQPSAVTATNDIRAAGLQVLPAEFLTGEQDEGDRGLIFAINTYGRWSAAYQNIFTISIFGNGPDPDFSVIGIDFGLATTGELSGEPVSLIVDAEGNPIAAWGADAPANGSTILLPALASDISRTDADSTVDYEVVGDNLSDSSNPADAFEDEVDGRASLSVFDPAVSNGDFIGLNPGHGDTLDVSVDEAGQGDNPSLGWMIVTLDDVNGAAQADLVPVGALP